MEKKLIRLAGECPYRTKNPMKMPVDVPEWRNPQTVEKFVDKHVDNNRKSSVVTNIYHFAYDLCGIQY